MDMKSPALFMRSLVVATLMAAASIPTVRHGTGAATVPEQPRTEQSTSAPIVVAQGRCFNGRCY